MNKLVYYAFSWLLAFGFFCGSTAVYGQDPARDSVLLSPPILPPVAIDTLVRPRLVLIDSLSYRFMGDGNFSRGNVNRSLVVLRAEVTLLGPNLDIVSHPRFTYGEQNGLLAERDLYADLFIDVFKKRRVYTFALATIERSNLRQINWRRLAGAGVGLRLLQTRHHTLTLTNAVIHEATDFRERPTITIQRNSTRLKGKHSLLADKLRLSHITFLQPALTDPANVRWNTLVTLELPLTWWLALRSTFENSYEGVVEAGRRHNDTRLTFGIAVGNRRL